ncbi:hypothetical protein [Candidatus Pyrohabitans sp.]
MKAKLFFADAKVKKAFEKLLNSSKSEDKRIHTWLVRAFIELQEDAFCGIQIPKRLIPKEYLKEYGINNLWKYNLPEGWRLLYSIAADEKNVVCIIIEWFDHKNYERRFGY